MEAKDAVLSLVLGELSDLRGRLTVAGREVLDELLIGGKQTDDEVIAHAMNVAGRQTATAITFDDETKQYRIQQRLDM